MTIDEKISHIQGAAMEEARSQGNEIIKQHRKALESMYQTHCQEARIQADTRIKAETASARQQLNTAVSKGQLRMRRELSGVQMEQLISYIADAARFAGGQPLTIYISKSDEDKKEYLEKSTGMTMTISEEDFIGGLRSVIPGKNILIDHSFKGALEKEYQEYTFKGGGAGE